MMGLPLNHKTSQPGNQIFWRILLMVFVIILTVLLILFRDQVQKLQVLGYPGIFLFSMLSNATLIVPIPGVVFTSAMGAIFEPFWVSLASGTGAAIGEISGYLAGVSGQLILKKSSRYDQLSQWMQKNSIWTILVLAFIPNPFFDIAGFAAGSMRIPLWKFLSISLVGKVCKMLLFAYLGAGVISFFG